MGKEEKKWPAGTRSDAIAMIASCHAFFGDARNVRWVTRCFFFCYSSYSTVPTYVQVSSGNRLERKHTRNQSAYLPTLAYYRVSPPLKCNISREEEEETVIYYLRTVHTACLLSGLKVEWLV
jgi:hypothetical protein